MPLLGMLAAGAAIGARDASNKSVAAHNQLEMQNARESLRQQFYDRNYTRQRADQVADREAAGRAEDRIYSRNRADKVADTESAREFQKGLLNLTEGNKMKMHNERMALGRDKLNQAKQAASGISGMQQGGLVKMQSTIGKEAQDYVASGQVKDFNEGFKLAAQKQAASIILGNPMNTMLPTEKLTAAIKDLADQLYSNGMSTGQATQESGASSTIRKFNPKTGTIE